MAAYSVWLVAKFLPLCLLFQSFFLGFAERTSQKIYKDLTPSFACFRRLNGTHQIGCSSDRKGNIGVIHYVTAVPELDWLLDHGPDAPYVVVFGIDFFNVNNLSKLDASEKVTGLIVLSPKNSTRPESGFSPDQTCPNRGHGFYDTVDNVDGCSINWNPIGDEMFFRDWSFPIFLVRKQDDIDSLLNSCYDRYNAPLDGTMRSWPLCAAQLSSNMYAARDAETCIRRSNMISNLNPVKVCDPLGDYNIFAPLYAMDKSTPLLNRSLIFVVARLDAFSMFDNIAPGGDTAVAGVVAVLAIAEALSRLRDAMKPKSGHRNVVFVLFNGEAFDYIGSSRMVYDMQRNAFPSRLDPAIRLQAPLIGLHHISHVIELGQVGMSEVGDASLWVHTDPVSTGRSKAVNISVDELAKLLKTESSGLSSLTVKRANSENPLPPASFQSFLKKDTEIAGVVLTDHNMSYTNRYYNSFLDVLRSNSSVSDESLSTVDFVQSTATVLVRTLYAMLTSESNDTLTASRDTVEQLLDYYSRTGNSTFTPYSMFGYKQSPVLPPNMYVGVDIAMSEMRVSTNNFLAVLMGEVMPNWNSDKCKRPDDDTIYSYRWMPNKGDGVCIKSTVNTSKAVSPAFNIEDYDFKSGRYSSWVESVWDEHSLRIFLKPSLRQELTTLCVGMVVLILSFVTVWFLNDNSDVLFPSHGGVPAVTTSLAAA